MRKIKKILFIYIFILPGLVFSQDRLSSIMQKELSRNLKFLESKEMPPYYISLRVNDKQTVSLSAMYGNLVRDEDNRVRILYTCLRVGSYDFDNTREIRDDVSGWFEFPETVYLSIEEEIESALTRTIWLSIDNAYKNALSKFNQVKANVEIKVESEDLSSDFSEEKIVIYYTDALDDNSLFIDRQLWKDKLRNYSSFFNNYPHIYDAEASLEFQKERINFVSSEGSLVEQNRISTRLFINAKVKADDGMELPLYISHFAFIPEKLPDDKQIFEEIKEMAEILLSLREAPVAESYTGPAILSGDAAGVFFHEIFGHRIEGHRLKLSSDGQTFKNKVGELVLPEHISLLFNPQMKEFDGEDLYGHYKYDDQGVEGQRVVIVENGILKNFLMSRTPIEGFSKSNGHGRANAGQEPVARQSNMIVETTNPLSEKQMRDVFKKELLKQEKEFGFYFKSVRGGFTTTGRFMPNSFNVSPLIVYKVFADGREDQLIRGVDLIGTPLAMFSQIIEAGDDYGIFQGNCGAESGWVPVSAISPGLIVRQIETQKNIKSNERSFILPAPKNNSEM